MAGWLFGMPGHGNVGSEQQLRVLGSVSAFQGGLWILLAAFLRVGVGRVAVVGLELSFHDVLVHKCSLNVREQNLLQAVCLGPVWHPQIIALKIGG